MTKKDYELIAGALWRSGAIQDKNKVKQQAREDMRRLIFCDLCGTLQAENPRFNISLFSEACGF